MNKMISFFFCSRAIFPDKTNKTIFACILKFYYIEAWKSEIKNKRSKTLTKDKVSIKLRLNVIPFFEINQ